MHSGPTRCHLTLCDCRTGLAFLSPESIDVVITSPPYNIGVVYQKYHDNAERSAYLRWTLEWVLPLKQALKQNGSFFLNVGATPSNPLLPHQIALLLSEHFTLQNTLHWIKSIALPLRQGTTPVTFGHFKPINSPRYITDCHEYIFHFTKGGVTPVARLAVGVPYSDKTNIRRWSHTQGRDRRCRGNNWFIPYRTIRNRASERPHPATFPVELASMCLGLHGAGPESTVLDPFLGIGNTALAAIKKGVAEVIGFEIDPDYLSEARARLAAAHPSDQPILKISPKGTDPS